VRQTARAAGPPIGRVAEVKGTAAAETDRKQRPLSTGGDVYEGDKVSTTGGSRVEVRLGQDTKVRLGGDASIRIDRFQESGGAVTLEAGPMLLEKPSKSTPESVAVRSPYGLVTVRDSKVFAGPSQGVFGILVVEGEATVQSGSRTIRLRSGEGTDIKSPGAAPAAPRRWGAGRVKAALASVA
jgi:hypothetical protein